MQKETLSPQKVNFSSGSDSGTEDVFSFSYTVKQILKFWLLRILPHQSIKIDYSKGTAEGSPKQFRSLQDRLKLVQSDYKVFQISHSLDYNSCLYVKKIFDCDIFGKEQILEVFKKIKREHSSEEVQNLAKNYRQMSEVTLSIFKIEHQKLMFKVLEKITDHGFRPQRDDIRNASLAKTTAEFKSVLGSASSSASSESSQSSSSSEDAHSDEPPAKQRHESHLSRYLSSERFEPVVSVAQQKRQRTSWAISEENSKQQQQQIYRRPLKVKTVQKSTVRSSRYAFNEEFSQNRFNIEDFRKYISSRKLQDLDFEFEQDSQQTTMTVKIKQHFATKQKINTVKKYFQFSKVCLLNSLSKEVREKARNRFARTYKELKCELIQGYKSANTSENSLRYLIEQHSLAESQDNSQHFYCFYIVGIKHHVIQHYNAVRKWLQTQIVKCLKKHYLIMVKLGQLAHYRECPRVVEFLTEHISTALNSRFPTLILNAKPKINKLNVEVNVSVKNKQNLCDFEDKQKTEIEGLLFKNGDPLKEIEIAYGDIDDCFLDKYILCRSHRDPAKSMLISYYYQAQTVLTEIKLARGTKMEQSTIYLRKGFLMAVEPLLADMLALFGQQIMTKFNEADETLKLFGTQSSVHKIKREIEDKLSKIYQQAKFAYHNLDSKQTKAYLSHHKQFTDYLTRKYKVNPILEHRKYAMFASWSRKADQKINVNADVLIMVIQQDKANRTMPWLPYGTRILFNHSDQVLDTGNSNLQQFKRSMGTPYFNFAGYKHMKNTEMKHVYAFGRSEDLFEFYNNFEVPNSCKEVSYCMFVPEYKSFSFIVNVVKASQSIFNASGRKVRVYLIDQHQTNFETQFHQSKFSKAVQFYVEENGDKFFYSANGDKKINQALSRHENKVYLSGDDLQVSIPTHRLYPSKNAMISLRNNAQNSIITDFQGETYYELENNRFKIPKHEVNKAKHAKTEWVEISVGCYEIDLVHHKQRNMFTQYKRDLKVFQTQKAIPEIQSLNIEFDFSLSQLSIVYTLGVDQGILFIFEELQAAIRAKKAIRKQKIPESVTQQIISSLISAAQDNQLESRYDQNQSLFVFEGFEEEVVQFEKILPHMLKAISTKESPVEYPKSWQPQTEAIQLFPVPEHSDQFQRIKADFSSKRIVKLSRIQNRIVYKRYYEQKKFLKEQNKGKAVKELMLYHGTTTTDPEVIYLDTEECFNINYTGQGNFLGRGTYFAVEPEYSVRYSFVNPKGILSMMYCEVLVGDSQKVKNTNSKMKDTEYKDPVNKIRYESATMFTNGSDIYAVYKNRRAYPMYLIEFV